MAEQGNNDLASEASMAELVRQLSDQTTLLARQEVALAKAELAEKGKRAGLGAGMFGGAGVAGAYAVGALVAAAILGLATAVDGWLAALIVGLVLAAVAGLWPWWARTRCRWPRRRCPRRRSAAPSRTWKP